MIKSGLKFFSATVETSFCQTLKLAFVNFKEDFEVPENEA